MNETTSRRPFHVMAGMMTRRPLLHLVSDLVCSSVCHDVGTVVHVTKAPVHEHRYCAHLPPHSHTLALDRPNTRVNAISGSLSRGQTLLAPLVTVAEVIQPRAYGLVRDVTRDPRRVGQSSRRGHGRGAPTLLRLNRSTPLLLSVKVLLEVSARRVGCLPLPLPRLGTIRSLHAAIPPAPL